MAAPGDSDNLPSRGRDMPLNVVNGLINRLRRADADRVINPISLGVLLGLLRRMIGIGSVTVTQLSGRFHPVPPFTTAPDFHALLALRGLLALPRYPSFGDVATMWATICELMATIGATGIAGFVKQTDRVREVRTQTRPNRRTDLFPGRRPTPPKKRKTKNAVFKWIKPTRCETKKFTIGNFKRCRSRDEGLQIFHGKSPHEIWCMACKITSKGLGRLASWFPAWIVATCAPIGKTGLTYKLDDVELGGELLATDAFISTVSALWAARKAFTTEKQGPGGLNKYTAFWLQKLKELQPEGLGYIAYLIPDVELWLHVPSETCEALLVEIQVMRRVIAIYLDIQWERGVWKSTRRGMRVLPSGARRGCVGCQRRKPISSSGWNVVAEAFCKLSDFSQVIHVRLGLPCPFRREVPQLIADDQFRMFVRMHGDTDRPDVTGFDALTRAGLFPWRSDFDDARAMVVIAEACGLERVATMSSPRRVRVDDAVRRSIDMVCGVAITGPNTEAYYGDVTHYPELVELGFAGAHVWTG